MRPIENPLMMVRYIARSIIVLALIGTAACDAAAVTAPTATTQARHIVTTPNDAKPWTLGAHITLHP